MAVHAAFMCNLRVHLFFLGLRIDDGGTDFRSGGGGGWWWGEGGGAALRWDNVGEDGREGEAEGEGGRRWSKIEVIYCLPAKNDCVEEYVLGAKFVNSAGMKMFGRADRRPDTFLSFSFFTFT